MKCPFHVVLTRLPGAGTQKHNNFEIEWICAQSPMKLVPKKIANVILMFSCESFITHARKHTQQYYQIGSVFVSAKRQRSKQRHSD